jgi:hypothetical protein
MIDSQSAKTVESGEPRDFDASKKVKGHKRHILTNTFELNAAGVVERSDDRDR